MAVILAAEFGTAELEMTLAILVLLFVSIFLSMAETALTRISPTRARAIASVGGFGTRRLPALVERPEQFLNVVLFLVLVCQLVQATLVGILGERLFGSWGVVFATIINVVVVFIVAEAIPKTWAIEHTERAARMSSTLVWRISRLWPLPWIARGLIGLTNVIIPGKGLKKGPFVSEEEFLALAEEAVSADILEEGERELIEQVIEFGDTICREVMVPRPDMFTARADDTVTDVLDRALAAGHSRVPVLADDIDDIIGVAYVKDLVRASRSGRDGALVRRYVRTPFFVPETKRISDLMAEMRARKSHIAVVVDEYGGTAGLVTLEDVLEELVGEIVDEYDIEDAMIERLPGGAVRVQARMLLDDLDEELDLELPEGDWDTIGGLMFHLLGHVPFEGESVRLDGLRLRAGRMNGRRIGTVTIERIADEPE